MISLRSFQVQIEVSLRENILHPDAEILQKTIQKQGFPELHSLHSLQYGKLFRFVLEATTQQEAVKLAESMASRFLCNPQLEVSSVQVGCADCLLEGTENA